MAEGWDTEAGGGDEPFEESDRVPHPLEPGPGRRGQVGEVALATLARYRSRCDHASSTGLSSDASVGGRQEVSQSRAATSTAIYVIGWPVCAGGGLASSRKGLGS